MVIDMRYLLFFFLFFFSHFSFSQAQSVPNCQSVVNVACTNSQYLAQSLNECKSFASHKIAILGAPGVSNPPPCNGSFNILYSCGNDCSCPDGKSLINGVCSCPSGTQWDQYPSGGGTCAPVSCPDGEIRNTIVTSNGNITSCIPEPEDNGGAGCDESEKVYDPVSGTLVCPGSGDNGGASSSASSQTCVVPGDYDGDCIVDSEQGSSINNSNPASSPNTSSQNTSSPSTGGGDDDGENPSTGGGGGGGGGGSTGGASGSASNASSGSNSSWTPNSGYGNWIPVYEDSNCPNKYKDNAGQWWCSGATNQGSAGSASGVCDPTATNYWSCINSGSAGSAASAGSASSDNSESKLTEKRR